MSVTNIPKEAFQGGGRIYPYHKRLPHMHSYDARTKVARVKKRVKIPREFDPVSHSLAPFDHT